MSNMSIFDIKTITGKHGPGKNTIQSEVKRFTSSEFSPGVAVAAAGASVTASACLLSLHARRNSEATAHENKCFT